MVMTNGTDGNKRSVSSLGELSRSVALPRDLWPSIESQISADTAPGAVPGERSRFRPTGMQWAALAAMVAALAVGIWVGRNVSPPQLTAEAAQEALNRRAAGSAASESPASGSAASENPAAGGLALSRPAIEGVPNGADPNATPTVDPNSLQAGFVSDPRYTMQRAALIRGWEAQLKTLPPDTQQKVASSLATIRTSITELRDALGKDPANALLQELLVNSYQDEMRVLTAVHEAGGASGGI
jgi:hypothetical protein